MKFSSLCAIFYLIFIYSSSIVTYVEDSLKYLLLHPTIKHVTVILTLDVSRIYISFEFSHIFILKWLLLYKSWQIKYIRQRSIHTLQSTYHKLETYKNLEFFIRAHRFAPLRAFIY